MYVPEGPQIEESPQETLKPAKKYAKCMESMTIIVRAFHTVSHAFSTHTSHTIITLDGIMLIAVYIHTNGMTDIPGYCAHYSDIAHHGR